MRLTKRLNYKLFSVVITSISVLKLLQFQQYRVRTRENKLSTHYPLALPLIDIILVNDEMDMLEYRLNLHHSIVSKFVIVESNVTFKGLPKPLYAKSLLATGRLEKFSVEVIQVPFSQSERESNDTWVRQLATRRFIGYWISQHYPNATVTLSDVDELFDTEALAKVLESPELNNLSCFFLPMRFLYYGEACPMSLSRWNAAPIFKTGSTWFREVVVRGEGLRLHTDQSPFVSKTCEVLNLATPLLGWHISYAMETNRIVNKIRSFSENAPFIQELINAHNVSDIIEGRLQRCGDLYGREDYPEISCSQIDVRVFDFKSPPLMGLPRHPLAPDMSIWDKCRYRTLKTKNERERAKRKFRNLSYALDFERALQ